MNNGPNNLMQYCTFASLDCPFCIGFSMGASLACAVVAGMLQDNLLSQEVITENLACITFGQPLIAVTSLEKLFSEQEHLKNCFHYVYAVDDAMPMLLLHAFVGQHAVSYACCEVLCLHCHHPL